MLQAGILIVFPVIMMFAALSDLFTMTISNRISLALIAVFPALALWAGLPVPAIGMHLVCGAGVLVLTFAMFAFGWIGGGDAKLAAATAVWMGFDHLADYSIVSSLAGGVLTLLVLALRHYPLPLFALKVGWLQRLHEHDAGVPYGIALAAAGLFMYPQTGLWHAALIA